MRHFNLLLSLVAAFAAAMVSCRPSASTPADTDTLVIIHTNDTHSAIDPDRDDRGGIARRKVLIDSIRGAHANTLLIDAGDAVQGSLYFTIFGGEVERRLMNAMGYEIRILGNHEFDNGMEPLAREWRLVEGDRLSANYGLAGTPLDSIFVPSVIKEYNGHKIGFIGINLDPAGMVMAANHQGVVYSDAVATANAEAARLKEQGAEMVIVVSHIGYDENGERPDDRAIAAQSRDIDLIIGGHSHTTIDPLTPEGEAMSTVNNLDGRPVRVLQTGSRGVNLGEITISLTDRSINARLIPVDARLDSRVDPEFAALIAPYRHGVDSLRGIQLGTAPTAFEKNTPEILNLLSDFVLARGSQIAGKPADLAIMNKGGIRNSLDKGTITKGEIIDILPFDNKIVVVDIKGSDLLENLAIMAARDGNGVSRGVSVTYDPNDHRINTATIDGKPIDPARTYRLATINYLADGGDYMTPLTRATRIAESRGVLYDELSDFIASGQLSALLAAPDTSNRMTAF